MRICQPHWDKLRAAIKARRIDRFGAKSGEEAIEDMKADLEGRPHDYDPTMDCNNMIFGRALAEGGLYLMGTKENGEHYCPICEVIRHKPDISVEEHERHWIDGPADAALAHCRALGLVPAVQ